MTELFVATRQLNEKNYLQYTFLLFPDSRSNPPDVYRVFRLVPCMQDRTRMFPLLRKLVTAGATDALEISNLPFYSIGGAGTHYPKKNLYQLDSKTTNEQPGL
jgi:hypothetical protein